MAYQSDSPDPVERWRYRWYDDQAALRRASITPVQFYGKDALDETQKRLAYWLGVPPGTVKVNALTAEEWQKACEAIEKFYGIARDRHGVMSVQQPAWKAPKGVLP